jgi:hypothetical protein
MSTACSTLALSLGFLGRRQNGSIVMRRHVGVGAIDERIIETGLDDGGLGIVRHEKMRHAADRLEGAHMGVDPIGERLRPACPGEREARRAKHGDKDLRFAHFPGCPVDDDRDAVTRVIDEEPLPGCMRLPHCWRELRFKGAIELAEPRIAVTAWILSDVFIPEDQQGDMLALELLVDRRPIRLTMKPMATLAAVIDVERCLQLFVAHPFRQGPAQPGAVETTQRLPYGRGRTAKAPRDLAYRDMG